ncbi:hypothetical protein PIB30_082922 [Stylosanthes scabra]|uniref:Uncharacterized protein n=1 Tax=Stylosanthes scabra TaxID=79078 RepID=A0ABU6QRQ4_9FABA|nr:hypothetical protein [Stylosanthes scabra]
MPLREKLTTCHQHWVNNRVFLQNSQEVQRGEASSAALNVTDSAKRDSTDGLQRKLDAIRKRNITVQSTSVTQQRSFENFAQSTGSQGQHNDVQLTPERIQQRQEEVLLPSSECELQPEGDMMDEDGSELGKGRLVVRATTIDEFLKEHGIDLDLDGIGIGEQTTELHDDTEDNGALDQNYYQYVMAESDDEEDQVHPPSQCREIGDPNNSGCLEEVQDKA